MEEILSMLDEQKDMNTKVTTGFARVLILRAYELGQQSRELPVYTAGDKETAA